MKKIYIFIFLLIVCTNSVVAQKQTRKKTQFQKNTISTAKAADNKNDSSIKDEKAAANIDSSVKILYKPRADYPQPFDGGTVCIQGVVTLRVQFLETGEIGEIKVISGLPYGATENAIEAAKRMKFEPAMKDGKAVTVTKSVQFSFTIY